MEKIKPEDEEIKFTPVKLGDLIHQITNTPFETKKTKSALSKKKGKKKRVPLIKKE